MFKEFLNDYAVTRFRYILHLKLTHWWPKRHKCNFADMFPLPVKSTWRHILYCPLFP